MYILLLPVFFPVLAGLAMFKLNITERAKREKYILAVLGLSVLFTAVSNVAFAGSQLTFAKFMSGINLSFETDPLAVFFSTIFAVIWLLVGIYSFEYIKHEGEDNRFFAFYLASLGALIGVAYRANMVTLYFFFEAMSLFSYVLVIHSRTNQSLVAGRKYIYYSLFGASLGLIAVSYDVMAAGGNAYSDTLSAVITLGAVIGFGCKCGMFPLHSWLPTAHPAAPAPASSVLSGLITKAGVIAIIRILTGSLASYTLRQGTVRNILTVLSVITIFMGSMLAYKEKVLKKRLAYSTVSQVSYVIFGLMIGTKAAFIGALLQVFFHALAKDVLFLAAGAFIYKTGKTDVRDLEQIGKSMPKTMACFSIAGLSLVGVPLTGGFVSKWYLAQGALESGSVLGVIGVFVIIASALLTAGYLVSVTAKVFFAKRQESAPENLEPNALMTVPMAVMSAAVVIFGIIPGPVINFIGTVADSLMIV